MASPGTCFCLAVEKNLRLKAVELLFRVRFAELKKMIEKQQRWSELNQDVSYFEGQWKPKSWQRRCRFFDDSHQDEEATQGSRAVGPV